MGSNLTDEPALLQTVPLRSKHNHNFGDIFDSTMMNWTKNIQKFHIVLLDTKSKSTTTPLRGSSWTNTKKSSPSQTIMHSQEQVSGKCYQYSSRH